MSNRSLALVLPVLASFVACSAGSDKGGNPGSGPGNGPGPDGGDPLAIDGGDFDAGYDPDAACAARVFQGTKLPLHISLVFDVSSSMNGGKLDSAKSGIKSALAEPRFDDVSVTLFRFGISGEADRTPFAGPVFLDPAGEAAFFPKVDELRPTGTTPLSTGLERAYKWLFDNGAAAGKAPYFTGKTVVALISDGLPSALSLGVDAYKKLVADARGKGVDTFVVGTLTSDEQGNEGALKDVWGSALLSTMAGAGTEASNLPAGCSPNPNPKNRCIGSCSCFFNLMGGFGATQFADVLDSIRKLSSSCVYALPAQDARYNRASPEVNLFDPATNSPTNLPRCTDPANPPAGGCWSWEKEGESVKLQGGACDAVKGNEKLRVDILLACVPT
jgi:uncharacterized protein YegL